MLHWTDVLARTNVELAFQFAAAAPTTVPRMSASAAEAWVVNAVDTYDRNGLHYGTEALRQTEAFEGSGNRAVRLEEVATVLQLFAQGLSGRALRLESAVRPYTDTETLYLPPRISRGATRAENFFRYKAIVALLWAQTRYGTYNADIAGVCSTYAEPKRALELLNMLETVRLEARLAETLPALAREAAALRNEYTIDRRCVPLLEPTASVNDSIAVLGAVYHMPPVLEDVYATVLQPEQAEKVRSARLLRDRDALRAALAQLLEVEPGDESIAFSAEKRSDREISGAGDYVLSFDGEQLTPPVEVARLMESIWQDLGELPEDYLTRGGPAGTTGPASDAPQMPDAGNCDAPYYYDEWDHARRHYRKRWCALRESDVPTGDGKFVEEIYAKHATSIVRLKRTFELLRGEEQLLKRQPDGDGIDLDALVEGYSDMRTGTELPPLLFTRRRRNDRDLAVMFMVDMSGSTKGWINDAEREALVMLCEALEALGDRYAIYGFSGMTRRRCEVYRVKRFDEPYGPLVRERISGIEPQDYTRMGAAIRHLTMLIDAVEARTKLLITLSDGKPEDYSDNYRGEYGIEDTRQALLEAHRRGVKPFCITIDHGAGNYLPHMYGAANWTLVDDVSRLPLKVADIYRHFAP